MNDIGDGHRSFLPPCPELFLQVSFELREFVSEHLTTAPAFVLLLEIGVLVAGISPYVILRKWKVLERNEEVGVEAVVVLLMLQSV